MELTSPNLRLTWRDWSHASSEWFNGQPRAGIYPMRRLDCLIRTYALGLPHTAEGCPILRGVAPWGGGLPHTAGSRYTWLCLDRTGLCSDYVHKAVFRLRTHTALRLGHGVWCFDCTGRCRAKSAPSQPESTQSPAASAPYLPKSRRLPNPPWFYALNLPL